MNFEILQLIVIQEIKKRFQNQNIQRFLGKINIIKKHFKSLKPLEHSSILALPPIQISKPSLDSDKLINKQTKRKHSQIQNRPTYQYQLNLDKIDLFTTSSSNSSVHNLSKKENSFTIKGNKEHLFSNFVDYFNNQR